MMRSLDKRIFLLLMTAITVSGFIVICTLGQSIQRQKTALRAADSVPELPAAECTVREYKGKIGVFRGESEIPYRIIDYDFSLLSEYDREQLSDGILIESDRELQQFIEDIAT